jgi:hypothetical protein
MTNGETLSGQHAGWMLLEKLAEGDAGEIYRVEAQLDGTRAILKRPVRSAFSGDIARQAAQIANEGKILQVLHPFLASQKDLKVSVPALLDQSLPGSERSQNQFIVIEPAPGIDLQMMTRLHSIGKRGSSAQLTAADHPFHLFAGGVGAGARAHPHILPAPAARSAGKDPYPLFRNRRRRKRRHPLE